MKIGIKSLQDFLAFLVRRKWWVIAPFVALACILTILTKELPRIYVSDSLVLIRPRDVPENFVMDLISGSTEQRLRSIQQTVLSRSNLVAILNEFRDNLPEFQALNTDEAVAKLRKQIKIDFDAEKDARGETYVTSFKISYQHKSPEIAQKINSKLTSLFIEQDSRTRASNVIGTTDFLSAELEKKAAELAQSDSELKALKAAHQTELPEQLETNLRALDRLNDQKKSNSEGLDRANNQLLTIQDLLAHVTATSSAATSSPASGSTDSPKNARVDDYRNAKLNYERMLALHPPTYPDTLTAKVQLDRLKARLSPEELEKFEKEEKAEREKTDEQVATTGSANETKPPQSPDYIRLSGALRDLETEIKLRQQDKSRIEAEIARYSSRVENTPQVELQLAEAIRKNQDLRKQYDELNTDLNKATLSQNLESKQRGSQFVVIDPANLPLEPAKPNKIVVLLAGWVISLALAIAIALGVDIARQRVWTQSEIETFWGVPVMIDIPQILTDSDLVAVRRRKWVFAASSLAAAGVYSVCLYVIYLNHSSILQTLDPVLQQLVYR